MTNVSNTTVLDESAKAADSTQIVQLALTYIDNHLDEKISLSGIAHQINVCRSTLLQCFRQTIGISPYAYVIHRKLAAAQEMISQGLSPIRAAEQLGFGDYSSFYRAFRKECGMSPSQWKQYSSHQPPTGQ